MKVQIYHERSRAKVTLNKPPKVIFLKGGRKKLAEKQGNEIIFAQSIGSQEVATGGKKILVLLFCSFLAQMRFFSGQTHQKRIVEAGFVIFCWIYLFWVWHCVPL